MAFEADGFLLKEKSITSASRESVQDQELYLAL